MKTIERIFLPRYYKGGDFGNTSIILIKKDNKMLLWQKGSSATINSLQGSKYFQTELSIMIEDKENINKGTVPSTKTIHTGGRLSVNLLKQYRQEIEKEFGIGIVEKILSVKKTIIINE